jgi:hypothetical protein
MSTDPHSPSPTHIPWEGPKGWGYAAFIVLLAAALVFAAYSIHRATFKPFRDPTNVDGDVPASVSPGAPRQ